MTVKYLLDVNMPYYFKLWDTPEYIHQLDSDPKAKDIDIWKAAKVNKQTIITKDSDFSNRMLLNEPPPRVIHIRFGNTKMKEFHSLINNNWSSILKLSETHKLVNVYKDRIEGIK